MANAAKGFAVRVFSLALFVQSVLSHSAVYTNLWAVEVDGGPEEARRLAEKHDFTYVSQMFSDFYLFRHPRVHRRSLQHSADKSQRLHSDVKWLEQQTEKTYNLYSASSPVHFNDPRWKDEWYINRENGLTFNVVPVWKQDITGKGIVVAVVDNGLDINHPELKDNYDSFASYDFVDDDRYPIPAGGHGDNCAGIIAGVANNSICGVGLAYNAKIGGIRLIGTGSAPFATDAQEAQALSFKPNYIDIYSNSWGPSDSGSAVEGPGHATYKALEKGANNGRDGKGSIYVFAAGNGGFFLGDSCAYNGYVNNIHTIAISGVNSAGSVGDYGEACPGILAVTYSRDRSGDKSFVVTAGKDKKCRDTFSSSSAAAAMASGLIALTLQANKDLTWRDVQHVIVQSSRPDKSALKTNDWKENGAGFTVSNYFGFGLMDAAKMVYFAKLWKTVPTQLKCEVSGTAGPRTIPPTGSLRIDIPLLKWPKICSNTINFLEHVQLRVNLTYSLRGDLLIDLRSPQGTVSNLAQYRLADLYSGQNNLTGWTFTTLHNWGEKAQGTWELSLRNHNPAKHPNNKGNLYSWTLILYGTETNPLEKKPHVTTSAPSSWSSNSSTTTEINDQTNDPGLPTTMASSRSPTTSKEKKKIGLGAVVAILVSLVVAVGIGGLLLLFMKKQRNAPARVHVNVHVEQVNTTERTQEHALVHLEQKYESRNHYFV